MAFVSLCVCVCVCPRLTERIYLDIQLLAATVSMCEYISSARVCVLIHERGAFYMDGDRRRKKNRFLPSFSLLFSSYSFSLSACFVSTISALLFSNGKKPKQRKKKKKENEILTVMLHVIYYKYCIYMYVYRDSTAICLPRWSLSIHADVSTRPAFLYTDVEPKLKRIKQKRKRSRQSNSNITCRQADR